MYYVIHTLKELKIHIFNTLKIDYVSKYNLYWHFLIQQNLLISSEKILMSVELKGCVT